MMPSVPITKQSASLPPSASPLYFKLLFVFFLFLFTYAHQPPMSNVTSLSRLDLLHAIFKEGRLTINSYHSNTLDKARKDGAFYSDKPPGLVVAAIPGFAAAFGLLRMASVDLDSPTGWLVSSWIACAFSIALLSAIGACAFCKWLSHWVTLRTAFLATCGLFLGAAALPYTTMLFPHALVVAMVCVALWVKRLGWPDGEAPTSPGADILAGLCLGLALASEFTSGLIVLALIAVLYWRQRKRMAFFALGAYAPLMLIPVYNFFCFDSPWILGYSQQASFAEMKHGLFGIRAPSFTVALQLLFNPAKGLFIWSPWLLLALLGFRPLFFLSPKTFWLVLLVFLLQLTVISGYRWDWPAGYNLTPRYLACIGPLLALPAALAIQRFPLLGASAVAVSIFFIASGTLLHASPEFDHRANYVTMYLPLIQSGVLAPNLGHLSGLPGYWSWLPFGFVLIGGMACFCKSAAPPVRCIHTSATQTSLRVAYGNS